KYVSKGNSIRLVFKSAEEEEQEVVDNPKFRRRTESDPNSANNPGFRARFAFIDSNIIPMTPTNTKSENSMINSSVIPPFKGSDAQPPPTSTEPRLIRRPEN